MLLDLCASVIPKNEWWKRSLYQFLDHCNLSMLKDMSEPFERNTVMIFIHLLSKLVKYRSLVIPVKEKNINVKVIAPGDGHWAISTIAMATCTHRFIHSQRTPEPQGLWTCKATLMSFPAEESNALPSQILLALLVTHTHTQTQLSNEPYLATLHSHVIEGFVTHKTQN